MTNSSQRNGLDVANEFYKYCIKNKVHFKDIWRRVEEKYGHLDEEVQEFLEWYVRYNVDSSFDEKDFDYAKKRLSQMKIIV